VSSTELTLAQEDRLIAIGDRWIAAGLSTERADRPRAESAVTCAYRRAGVPGAVRTIWASSPMAGARIADSLMQRASTPRAAVDVVTPIKRLAAQRVSEALDPAVSSRLAMLVEQPVETRVGGEVWGPIAQQVARLITRPIPVPAYGQHDARWLALYDGLSEFGLNISDLDSLMEIAQSCGWWWSFDDVCVLTERPVRLARDERGRLHSADGPAVAYPDGWSLYAWHGTIVPADIILQPAMITVARIQREANVEIRRVLLERYGFDAYIDDSGSIPVHADDTGSLYRCEMAGDEPLVAVSVMNHTPEVDGSRKRYVLRVPPDMTEAHQAVAWTFGLQPGEYWPVRET